MNDTPQTTNSARRQFLLQMGGMAGAALLQAHWPAVSAAAQHAHDAVQSKQAVKFEVLTPQQARDVQAVAARILPTDELPGATEAGVVYFIDHALKTFASDTVPVYVQGLSGLNQMISQMFPTASAFSAATPEEQDKILSALEKEQEASQSAHPASSRVPPEFLQTIWMHTLMGFLVDPDGGGNRDYAGWKVIGRDPAHSFSPPFGFYDKSYPGWQPSGPETGKK